jgi:hypothetical protein
VRGIFDISRPLGISVIKAISRRHGHILRGVNGRIEETPSSGGMMPNVTRLIDTMIAKTPDWRGATLAKLRKIIQDADPEMTEEVKWRRPSSPMGAPVWEHNGIVCVGNILKESVRLTFSAGASLPDPKRLFNARLESSRARAIDVHERDKLNVPALKALIRSGVEYNLAKGKPAKDRKR